MGRKADVPGLPLIVLAAVAVALLSGCLKPLDMLTLNQVKDRIGPRITIASPTDGSTYAATVVLVGAVSDASTDSATKGSVHSLAYEVIPATLPGGAITVAADGSFSCQFPTTGFSGPMVIKLIAEDWNGNRTEATISLADLGAIPGFTATPGNHQVTLSWDPVPLAQSYTLFYEKSDIIPSQGYSSYLTNVTSPCVLPNLVNGDMHTFLLRAISSSGADNWSRVVKAIPLSPAHLTPTLTPSFGSILVEWNPVAASDQYEVWRSGSPGGLFTNISGTIRGNRFLDTSVAPDLPYYYAVKSAAYNDTLSMTSVAKAAAFRPGSQGILGSVDTPGDAQKLVVSDPYAYVADGPGGLRIINIADPANPVETGHLTLSDSVVGVAVYGSYAYLAAGSLGLRIVDVSNKANPVEVGSDVTGITGAQSVVAGYPYVYVADYWSGVHKIDVTNPASPVEKAVRYSHPDYAVRLALVTTRLYVLDDVWSLRVFDVSGTTISAQLGSNDNLSYTEGVAVSGSYAYVAEGSSGLSIFNVSNPASIPLVGTLATSASTEGVAVSSGRAYVADGSAGLRVVDVSNPALPVEVGSFNTSGNAQDVVVVGTTAWVADGASGLHSIDVSSLKSITQSGVFDPNTYMGGVAVGYPYAYVADSSLGLRIMDISTPSSPQQVASLSMAGAFKVTLSGSYAYVVDQSTPAIRIVDVSHPTLPVESGSIGTNSLVTVSGPYAYLCSGELQIFDVSVPSSPKEVGFIDSFSAKEAVIRYPYAYVTDGSAGLHIVDISNPRAPHEKSFLATGGLATNVAVSGTYAYVTHYWGGFAIVDITDPSLPKIAGSVVEAAPRYPSRIAVDGPYAFITDADTTYLRVFDVSNPARIVKLGSFNATASLDVGVCGRYAYLADGLDGFRVISLSSN